MAGGEEAREEGVGNGEDGVVRFIRVLLAAVYIADVLILADALTHGEIRLRAAGWWRSQVGAPWKARQERIRAERHVVWEAMTIVDAGA